MIESKTTEKKIGKHRKIIQLERLPNGDFINWGRHGPNHEGPALYYSGEAAKVLALVIKHDN